MIRRFFRYYFLYYLSIALTLLTATWMMSMTDDSFPTIIISVAVFIPLWLLAMATEETNRWIDADKQR